MTRKFDEALALHRQGRLEPAELLYREVLRDDPRQAQAMAMLGVIEAAKGQGEAAADLLRRSLQLRADNPAAHFNLGLILQDQCDHAEALACFDRALALSAAASPVWNARGVALKNLGRHSDAVASYDKALALVPQFFDALHNKGVALRHLGRHGEAVVAFTQALQVRPDSVTALNNMAFALHQEGRDSEALAAASRARALDSTNAAALNTRGIVLHALGRFREAEADCRRALELDPGSAQAAMNLGVALYELKRFEEALAAQQRALVLEPANIDVRLNLGNVLLELNRPEEALENLRLVIDERPTDQDALMNMGNALRDLHRFDEGLSHYRRALALDDSCADVHWNLALCLLTMGDFEAGWAQYEWRRRIPSMHDARALSAPEWRGNEPLSGKTILVHAEQGLGDTLQFCRYASELAVQGAHVVLEVQRPLVQLLRTLSGAHTVVARGEPLPSHDFHVPMLSLPLAFGTNAQNIPAGGAYLHADPALVEQWRPLVDALAGPRIGIAWSGNAGFGNDHRRSMPLATLLAGLPEHIHCWCLQKDVSEADQLFAETGRVKRFEATDFVNTAAQIMLMDAVVSVDTSIAHLAAALGKPVFLLLAHTADWRWMWPGTDSPWYPTVTLFRQDSAGDWASPLQRLAARLEQLTGA